METLQTTKKKFLWFLVILAVICSFTLGVSAGAVKQSTAQRATDAILVADYNKKLIQKDEEWQKRLVKEHLARYNQDTGVWEMKPPIREGNVEPYSVNNLLPEVAYVATDYEVSKTTTKTKGKK